jgi:DNA polymerase
MSLNRFEMLDEMGLSPQWKLRESLSVGRGENEAEPIPDAEPVAPIQMQAEPESSADREQTIAQMAWDELGRSISACRACALCKQRKQAVPGGGDQKADWLFIGEGPGAEEDERGEPFVGQAGRLLDSMLAAVDLQRGDDVYIANAVKCRPPSNRTPEATEMASCLPYLRRQIALIEPKLIVLLGRAAAHSILGVDTPLSSLRGQSLVFRNGEQTIPVVVTYHPAYLLRTLPDKSKAWEDLCRARTLMGSLKQNSP